jgi:hypothetical protein
MPLKKIILLTKLLVTSTKVFKLDLVLLVFMNITLVSCGEPIRIEEALNDPDWVNAMHQELNTFARNEVWELIKRQSDHNVIGTKWVF